jgi:hypothetical protein
VGLKSLKSLNLTNGYPNKNNNKNKNKNNKVKSKPLELFELADKKIIPELSKAALVHLHLRGLIFSAMPTLVDLQLPDLKAQNLPIF